MDWFAGEGISQPSGGLLRGLQPVTRGRQPGAGWWPVALMVIGDGTRREVAPPKAVREHETEDEFAAKMLPRAARSPARMWAGSTPPARLTVRCGGFRPPWARSGPTPTSNRTSGWTRGAGHDQTPVRSSTLSQLGHRASGHLLLRCAAGRGRAGAPHLSARSGPEMSHLRRCAAPRAVVLRRAEVRIKGRLPRLHSAPWFELICRRPGRI